MAAVDILFLSSISPGDLEFMKSFAHSSDNKFSALGLDLKKRIDCNCDVLPLSLDDLLNYTTLMLKFCTNKRIWASLLRQVCF